MDIETEAADYRVAGLAEGVGRLTAAGLAAAGGGEVPVPGGALVTAQALNIGGAPALARQGVTRVLIPHTGAFWTHAHAHAHTDTHTHTHAHNGRVKNSAQHRYRTYLSQTKTEPCVMNALILAPTLQCGLAEG